jgi:hypothetical protein
MSHWIKLQGKFRLQMKEGLIHYRYSRDERRHMLAPDIASRDVRVQQRIQVGKVEDGHLEGESVGLCSYVEAQAFMSTMLPSKQRYSESSATTDFPISRI